jgi:hypothetical protein
VPFLDPLLDLGSLVSQLDSLDMRATLSDASQCLVELVCQQESSQSSLLVSLLHGCIFDSVFC